MSSISSVRDYDHAIYVLDRFLLQRDYVRRCREGVAAHIRATGCLEGVVPEFLDAEDLETATEILVDAFEPASYGSPEWSEDDSPWSTNLDSGDWLIDPETGEVHPRPEPDAPDESAASGESYWAAMMADDITPLPVSGGAPDHFEPSEADLQDYARVPTAERPESTSENSLKSPRSRPRPPSAQVDRIHTVEIPPKTATEAPGVPVLKTRGNSHEFLCPRQADGRKA